MGDDIFCLVVPKVRGGLLEITCAYSRNVSGKPGTLDCFIIIFIFIFRARARKRLLRRVEMGDMPWAHDMKSTENFDVAAYH